MAIVYLRSTDGNDGDDGSTWALADATLGASVVAAGAGGTSFVSQVHAESQATPIIATSSGTPSNPSQILCGNDAAEPPTALVDTASITTTGASSITIRGSFYCYGLKFNVGNGAGSASLLFNIYAADDVQYYEKCQFKLLTTSLVSAIQTGLNSSTALFGRVKWKDVDVLVSHTSQAIQLAGNLQWIGGSWLSGGIIPTNGLFESIGINRDGDLLVENVDFSQVGASAELVNVSNTQGRKYIFRNCLLSASLAGFMTGAFAGPSGAKVIIENCDSGDTNYKFEHISYEGNVREETTIIRTGGASDGDTGYSMEMVSSANTVYPLIPLESLEIPVRIDSVGSSLTITVEIVHDSQGSGAGSDLQDDEIGLHVSFSDTVNSTQYTLNTSEKADYLAAATDYANSSETWTTTGLTTPVKQTLTVTMTPEEKGYYVIKVLLYKASSTVFVCPKVSVA